MFVKDLSIYKVFYNSHIFSSETTVLCRVCLNIGDIWNISGPNLGIMYCLSFSCDEIKLM